MTSFFHFFKFSPLRLTIFFIAPLFVCLYCLDSASGLDQIRLGLNWLPQADVGGFYQALADGTYKKYGLQVKIYPGGPQINSAQMLASGAFDFARIPTGFTMFNMVEQHLQYVAVAAIYQHDPQILISHSSQNIRDIRDMLGHPIMMTHESTSTWWPVLKAKYNFSDSQIRPYTNGNASFIATESAITQGYYTSDLPHLRSEGVQVDYFRLSDYGYNPYSSLIVTSEAMITNKPDVVARFVHASAEGWRAYLHGNHEAADQLMIAANPDFSAKAAGEGIAAINSAGIVEGGDASEIGIGAMTDARWEEFFNAMVLVHNVPPDLDWKSAYTTRFVKTGSDLKR